MKLTPVQTPQVRFQGKGETLRKYALPIVLGITGVAGFGDMAYNFSKTEQSHLSVLLGDTFSPLKETSQGIQKAQAEGAYADVLEKAFDATAQKQFNKLLVSLKKNLALYGTLNAKSIAETMPAEAQLDEAAIKIALKHLSNVQNYPDLKPALNAFADEFYKDPQQCQRFKEVLTQQMEALSDPLLWDSNFEFVGIALAAILGSIASLATYQSVNKASSPKPE